MVAVGKFDLGFVQDDVSRSVAVTPRLWAISSLGGHPNKGYLDIGFILGCSPGLRDIGPQHPHSHIDNNVEFVAAFGSVHG